MTLLDFSELERTTRNLKYILNKVKYVLGINSLYVDLCNIYTEQLEEIERLKKQQSDELDRSFNETMANTAQQFKDIVEGKYDGMTLTKGRFELIKELTEPKENEV